MRGLIIKDMMSFRKRLVTVVFVTVTTLILAVMFSISAKSGNLYLMTVPGPTRLNKRLKLHVTYFHISLWCLCFCPCVLLVIQ